MGAARRRRSSRGARLRWGIGAAVAVLAATAGYALYTHQKARNTQRLLHDAQAYQEQEDWANAAIAYRQYLRRRPDDRDALPAYGDVLYRQLDASPQSAADAVGVFRKLLDADPSNIEAISKLASIWLAFGRFSEAEDLSRRWVELAPQSLEAAMARARALYGRGKHEEAVDALQQALLRMPKEGRLFPPLIRLLAVELQKPEEALTWADRAIQAAPELAEVQMAVFALHQQRGDYDTAERHLLRAMELAPESADTITAGGAFFTSRGELDRAADVFERGAKLFPADHRLLVARRVWAIRKNDPSEMARVAADLTAYAAANDPSLLAQAADLLLRARHDDGLNECIAALHAASEANEELAGWHHALKGMRALLNHRPTTAVIHLDDAERLLPASAAIKTLLARAFAEV
ncbi:MAG: tetratricopeptide repeat protein, partial [Phycisphaerae bacterium]